MLPEALRSQLVVTQSAGNCNMDIQPALDRIKSDPTLAKVLRENFGLFATTLTGAPNAQFPTGAFSNHAPGDRDVMTLNNPAAAQGTSFAAPAGLAFLEQIVDQVGVTPAQALLAAKTAEETNATGQLVLDEALDKAWAILDAAASDPPGAQSVTAITLTSLGTTTSAVITPQIEGVTVQYTVSGTDGYYDSGTLTTNASGAVSFFIPSGADGVRDRISVTASLTGVTDTDFYVW